MPASRPATAAERLEVRLGSRTGVGDDLGRAQPAQSGALDRAHAVGEAEEESRGEEIAGPGRVDDPVDRGGRHRFGTLGR